MKSLFWLLCSLVVHLVQAHDSGYIGINGDPIALSKKIISENPEKWTPAARDNIRASFKQVSPLGRNDDKYVLLESPGLAFDYFQGGYVKMGQSISKGLLLEILDQAVNHPQAVASKLAQASINASLKEYGDAYGIAVNYLQSDELSLESALVFLENRYGLSKLGVARQLLDASADPQQIKAEEKNKKLVLAKLKEIDKKYPDQIAWVEALPLLEEWYRLLEEGEIGLASYRPYIDFKRAMDKLNQQRINDRISFRSNIRITYPDSKTVWTQPGPVDLKWESTHIDNGKPIRFFLVKDDMVVQDLGTYKNSEYRDGIELRRGLPEGSNYRVMGIEQQPVNKYHVAKFATPFFTIEKAPRKPRPEKAVTMEASTAISNAPSGLETTAAVQPMRKTFAGRSISYVKELVVDSDQIQIILWDHGRQDGDLVSIYLNGEEVIKKHLLTYREVLFEIELDSSQKNDLFLYAHNLGKFPPNTVSIKIKDNSSTEEIVLNSDLKSCESVLINVKQ